ncbi:unnamed protein product (macronuclear) [Paramecium tetraurelia]|uniref:Uncharacterized protein n=1 Tax=Paramecium tetraurelia TaxID=5888 RepID=A0DUN5_PARTE|nr:uncharacterized protein GSPATT00020424001 [Paramecium tetraurelia]CAK86752.1 unnamed protein product [Paramecium tetraurelia]|eukprot:XP_001454149.1 hypothetical protein (macronuclear) [Paramecium tetraurelia strain d4-2]
MGCGSSQAEAPDKKNGNHTQKNSISSPDSGLADKQKLYQRASGNYLLKKGKYDQAINLFNRVIEIDPEFADAYYSKAIVAFEQNKIQDAQNLLQITLEKQPDHVYALNEAGCLMIKQRKFPEALDYLEKAFAKQQNFSEVNYSLGINDLILCQAYALSKLNRKEESLKYYDLAIQEDSQQKHFYINKATTLFELNKHEDALKCVSEALKLDSNYIEALITQGTICNENLGNIYKATQQFDKMYSTCFAILKLDNNNKLVLQMKEEAEKNLNIQITDQQSSTIIPIEDKLTLAENLVSEKQYDQARKLVNQILQKDPQHNQALRLSAKIQVEQGQYGDALATLNKVLSQQPKDISVLKEKAFVLEKLKRLEDALQCHNMIIDEETNQEKKEKQANMYMKLGKVKEASEIFESLNVKQSLDDPQTYIFKGKLLLSQEKLDEGMTFVQEGLEKNKNNIEIMQLLAQFHKAKKNEKEALNLHQQVLDIDKHNDCSHFEKGLIYCDQNLYKKALESLHKINNLDFNELCYFYFGLCYNKIEDYKNCIKNLNTYVKIGRVNLEQAYFMLGGSNLFLLKFDEAEENYLDCIRQNPNNAEAHYQLGNVYKQDKQIEEAKKYFELAHNLEPYNETYKQTYETFVNEKNYLVEYSNSLLFTLSTLIGLCQLNQKQQDYDQQKSEKYLNLLLLLETNQKKRFNTIENHFEQLKQLIAKSYDMQYTVIDDTLFPIMQYWHNQKICKKKKDANDFVSSIIHTVKLLVNINSDKILNVINSEKSLNNKYCVEFANKSQHELYKNRSGCLGLVDGIKILGFLLKYHKDFSKDRMAFSELLATKYQVEEIQIFHESYFKQ